MTQEVLKLALEALKKCHYYMIDAGLPNQSLLNEVFTASTAIKEALREHAMREVQRLGQEIEQEPVGDEWTPCIKLPVIVHVRKQRHGETYVSTREGITPVNLEDLIMRGVSGEEYPIGRAIFEQTYSLDTTQPQRIWVGLTDEEIWKDDAIMSANSGYGATFDTLRDIVRAIEAKLKQKNMENT